MSVKILCAGCSKEEREQAEADVRKALADRWSVTLDAPAARMRGVTVVAPQGRLVDSIRAALRDATPGVGGKGATPAAGARAPARTAAPAAPSGAGPAAVPSGGRLLCEKCGGGFVVVFDSRPGDSLEAAPVACPHCWHVNRVLIDAEAAFNRDYRAEKV